MHHVHLRVFEEGVCIAVEDGCHAVHLLFAWPPGGDCNIHRQSAQDMAAIETHQTCRGAQTYTAVPCTCRRGVRAYWRTHQSISAHCGKGDSDFGYARQTNTPGHGDQRHYTTPNTLQSKVPRYPLPDQRGGGTKGDKGTMGLQGVGLRLFAASGECRGLRRMCTPCAAPLLQLTGLRRLLLAVICICWQTTSLQGFLNSSHSTPVVHCQGALLRIT